MRLFIASPVILDDYEAIQKDFKGIMEGKWVAEENLHLTWVFLGETKDPNPVLEKLERVTALKNEAEITELGYFGRPPKIFFAGTVSKMLYEKAKEFKEAGFELYRFKPHITLCRIKKIYNYKTYKEVLKSYREKVLGEVLPQIYLYKSNLQRDGARYTRFTGHKHQ